MRDAKGSELIQVALQTRQKLKTDSLSLSQMPDGARERDNALIFTVIV